jgi:hypothetical protein
LAADRADFLTDFDDQGSWLVVVHWSPGKEIVTTGCEWRRRTDRHSIAACAVQIASGQPHAALLTH